MGYNPTKAKRGDLLIETSIQVLTRTGKEEE